MKSHLLISVGLLSVGGLIVTAHARVGLAAAETAAPEKKVPMLFVQTAKGATLNSGKLTLMGVSPITVYFSDRPTRIAGHLSTAEMIPLWTEGKDSFTKDPPNATLSSFTSDGKVVNTVVELKTPVLDHDEMTYEVRVLEGKVPENAQGVSLFIDVVGMPLTPVSYAGAARRARRRAVVVH